MPPALPPCRGNSWETVNGSGASPCKRRSIYCAAGLPELHNSWHRECVQGLKASTMPLMAYSEDREMSAGARLRLANGRGGFEAIRVRHLNVHQCQIERLAPWRETSDQYPLVRWLTSARNSSRVSLRLRNAPSMALVIAPECCFSTPRIIMQKWRASQITPTPSGLMASCTVCATCCVSRS